MKHRFRPKLTTSSDSSRALYAKIEADRTEMVHAIVMKSRPDVLLVSKDAYESIKNNSLGPPEVEDLKLRVVGIGGMRFEVAHMLPYRRRKLRPSKEKWVKEQRERRDKDEQEKWKREFERKLDVLKKLLPEPRRASASADIFMDNPMDNPATYRFLPR